MIGAAGFIGPHVVAALERRGVEVVAAGRSGSGPHGEALDRDDPAAVVRLVRARRIEVVIDMLALTTVGTAPLIDALEGRVGRYVLASSADVYRNYEGLHRRAHPEPITTPVDETSALRRSRHPYRRRPRRAKDAPDAWLDDYDKIPIETAARERFGAGATILRLPMIFGPKDRQRRFRWILGPMLAGGARLRVDPAWAGWRTTYGYVDDVGDALATAAIHPEAGGRTFNVGEAEPPDHRAWIQRFAAALGWKGEVEESPAPADSPIAGLDLRYPLILDSHAFRRTLDWREPTPPAQALLRTAEDERARG